METDYKMISEWWEGHKWPVIPASSLSRNGLIVHEDGENLSCGFLYGTDSDISIIEWVLSNPTAGLVKRSIGVKVLVAKLTELSQTMGYGVCMTWLNSRSLIKCFGENGYVAGDKKTSHFIRRFA